MKRTKSKFTLQPKNVLYLFIGLLSIASIFYACKKSIDESLDNEITEFIKSNDFKSQTLFKGLSVDSDNSKITYDQNNPDRPVIHLVLNNQGKRVAVLDVIKNTNEKILLPNGGKFFILYRDVSNFDFETMSGQIKLIDVNYDKHVINTLRYENSINKYADFKPLDIEIMQKYSKIIESNYLYFSSKDLGSNLNLGNKENVKRNEKLALKIDNKISLAANVPCDKNHNGDLSFSECYSCMNGACASNSDCYTLCYGLGDVVGWLATGYPHCQAAIGASCIYLSIEY